MNHFIQFIPGLLALSLIGWFLWRWLKASDEPYVLIIRWIITAIVLGFALRLAAKAKDGFHQIEAVLVSAVCGLIMTIVWRQRFCDFVADRFASFYTGGGQEIEPQPFYAIAEARRKQGRYADAVAEVQNQLARFPTDFKGWLMLAEIQAEDLKDLASAQATVEELLQQPGHAAKNIAYLLNRQADWHLKFSKDREAAQSSLERIIELLPETEQAQLARQRIAHLTPAAMLSERDERPLMALAAADQRLGLRTKPRDLPPEKEDPATQASRFVRLLEEHPYDNDAREKLALVYAREYQRLDLATDQLEQLIAFPNQPAKQVVHWLNLLADLQIDLTGELTAARQTLQRVIELYPKSAAADGAQNRLAYLKLELRPKQESQVVKLGSYEQNIGLKRGRPPENGENPAPP